MGTFGLNFCVVEDMDLLVLVYGYLICSAVIIVGTFFFFLTTLPFSPCQRVSKTKFPCKSTGEWINKLWYTHSSGILCRNELLIQQ